MKRASPSRTSKSGLALARRSTTLLRAFRLGTVPLAGLADGATHFGVRSNVSHRIIVHHAQVAFSQSLSQSLRHFRLGFHDAGPHLFDHRPHFLFASKG